MLIKVKTEFQFFETTKLVYQPIRPCCYASMQVDEGEKERIKVAVAVIVRPEVMIEAGVMIEIEVVILAESEGRG
jgi:hypothetical protein